MLFPTFFNQLRANAIEAEKYSKRIVDMNSRTIPWSDNEYLKYQDKKYIYTIDMIGSLPNLSSIIIRGPGGRNIPIADLKALALKEREKITMPKQLRTTSF